MTKAKMSINNTGKKHTYETRIKIGKSLLKRKNNTSRAIKPHTNLKLSLRCPGVRVEVYDKSKNLIKFFTTITSAAKYFNISRRTLVSNLKTGISYDGNYILKSEIKDIRVFVYSNDHKLLNVFYNVIKASV
jgi:NUMOD1 domain